MSESPTAPWLTRIGNHCAAEYNRLTDREHQPLREKQDTSEPAKAYLAILAQLREFRDNVDDPAQALLDWMQGSHASEVETIACQNVLRAVGLP